MSPELGEASLTFISLLEDGAAQMFLPSRGSGAGLRGQGQVLERTSCGCQWCRARAVALCCLWTQSLVPSLAQPASLYALALGPRGGAGACARS